MQSIAEWLERLGLGQYAQRFAENGIDVSVLQDLTDQDLREVGVLLGCASAISAVLRLPKRHPRHPTESTRKDDAECRRLTDMFCDLVDSTGSRQGSIQKICVPCLGPITNASRRRSPGSTASLPNTWAMGCSSISAIFARTRTMRCAQCVPGGRSSKRFASCPSKSRSGCASASRPGEGRGLFRARARGRASAAGQVLGTTRGNEHGQPLARSGQTAAVLRSAHPGLWLIHRGVRYAGRREVRPSQRESLSNAHIATRHAARV
jgi:hypothetical protein